MHTPNADVARPELKQSAYGPVGLRSEPDCDPLRLRRMGAARMLWLMRSLPVSLLEAEMGPGPVLILSSQPGDETLGCGGLSAIAQAGGRPVYILILTDGLAGCLLAGDRGRRQRDLHEAGCRRAAEVVGVADANIRFLGIHDIGAHRGEATGNLMQTVEAHARTIGVLTLVTTWRHDPSGNHLATSILGRRVAERMNLPLFEYPLSGWTLPTRRVLDAQVPTGFRLDVSDHLVEKRRAIKCHNPELFEPLRDSSEGPAMESRLLACFSGRFETFIRVPVGGRPPIPSSAAPGAPVIPT